MTNSVVEFLQVVIPSFFGGGLVIFLAKNWFLERLRGGIKSEYDQELERLKAALSKEATIISAVQKSFGESHTAYQTHRIHAIKELWEAILHVQRHSPNIFTFLDVLLPSEFDEVLSTRPFQTFSDVSFEDISKMTSDKAMEAQNHRLLTGEYLWSLFSAYLALSARIAMLFKTGREKSNVVAWYMDSGCISIVRSVCTSSEFAEFEQQQHGKIIWIRNLIESKFLLASSRILSGQSSSEMAMEEAGKIASAVSAARING
jgi:hypothetical protein